MKQVTLHLADLAANLSTKEEVKELFFPNLLCSNPATPEGKTDTFQDDAWELWQAIFNILVS